MRFYLPLKHQQCFHL